MGRVRVFAVVLLLMAAAFVRPNTVRAASDTGGNQVLTAYLDGEQIPLTDVSKFYCDDFTYPVIQCSRLATTTELRSTLVLLMASTDYVTIYDLINYNGSYMHVSQDYAMLASIGWNDKVSSFKGRNSETGTFWTDWFNGGSSWSFCCNTTMSSLGTWNNTFSSIERT